MNLIHLITCKNKVKLSQTIQAKSVSCFGLGEKKTSSLKENKNNKLGSIQTYLKYSFACGILSVSTAVFCGTPPAGKTMTNSIPFLCNESNGDIQFQMYNNNQGGGTLLFPTSQFFSPPGYRFNTSANYYFFYTSSQIPTIGDALPTSLTDVENLKQTEQSGTNYFIAGSGAEGETCVLRYTFQNAVRSGFTRVELNSATISAAVPVFSPFGLAAIVGGLLWFGRRRKLKLS